MKQIETDLWETETESPAPGLTTHAYLLTREDGNVLFYNTGHLHEIEQIAQLGGVVHQYLSHRDELGESLKMIRERFGARLGGHVAEQADFAAVCAPDILFEKREMLQDNIEVIPTPGHTPGSSCFLVHSPGGETYLFTGDTLYFNADDEWEDGYIEGYSDRATLAESLLLLRDLRPDLVLSSAFGGDAGFQRMNPDSWPDCVDRARRRLLR